MGHSVRVSYRSIATPLGASTLYCALADGRVREESPRPGAYRLAASGLHRGGEDTAAS
jgi:hypothetical protein